MNRKTGLLGILMLLLTMLLSGCFVKTVDELYTLPKHSDEYNDLQQAIDAVMTQSGAAYCAPVSGANQQSVQLADLDGDGEDEAVVFLKTGGEKPLGAYIFDLVDGRYENIAVIEGSGSAFASADYVQFDNEGGAEIIIGRKLSDQVLQSMSVYSLTDGHVVELMSANYTEYTVVDLDGDGLRDLFLIRFDAEQPQAAAELYRFRDGQMEREPEAQLSLGVQSVRRIVTGDLTRGVPAVFVASAYQGDSILTDVFAFRGGSFCNVTLSDSDLSVQTVRSYYVYATDIDSDGLIELPELVPLARTDSADEGYSLIRWYNLDLHGGETVKQTTYHNFSAGWYVRLPDEWDGHISIARGDEVSGVRGLCFSGYTGSPAQAEEIFTIYAFSGEDRNRLAAEDGRFILSEKGDVTYAARLGTSRYARGLTEESLKGMFNYIHVDWNSGET